MKKIIFFRDTMEKRFKERTKKREDKKNLRIKKNLQEAHSLCGLILFNWVLFFLWHKMFNLNTNFYIFFSCQFFSSVPSSLRSKNCTFSYKNTYQKTLSSFMFLLIYYLTKELKCTRQNSNANEHKTFCHK